jgi:hypothetical protein
MEEMQQLLNMGFPNDLAAQALAATGGKSTLKATEWILNHKSSTTTTSTTFSTPKPSQPKLDRFFHLQSKPPNNPSSPTPSIQIHQTEQQEQEQEQELQQQSKRPKLNSLHHYKKNSSCWHFLSAKKLVLNAKKIHIGVYYQHKVCVGNPSVKKIFSWHIN